MKNLSIREKVIIGVLLVFIVGYVYFTFFLDPMLTKISDTNSSIKNYEAKLQEIQNISANDEKMKANFEETKQKYDVYLAKIPYLEKDPEIAYNFKFLTDKDSVRINNITIGEPAAGQTDKALFTIPVAVDLNSPSYPKMMNLINSLEKDKRLVEVQSINMSNVSGTPTATGTAAVAGVHAGVNLNYYYLQATSPQAIDYTFNKGVYGKPDLFK